MPFYSNASLNNSETEGSDQKISSSLEAGDFKSLKAQNPRANPAIAAPVCSQDGQAPRINSGKPATQGTLPWGGPTSAGSAA